MAGSFPAGVTAYTNPGPTDEIGTDVGGRTHDEFHADTNDDLEAVQAKLGTGASTPAANTVLRGTGAGTTAYGQVVAADIANDTITATQLAADAVGASELADNAVVDANVAAGAAIAVSKLAAGGTADRVVATTDGLAVTLAQVTNAMISASAGIAKSKLAALDIVNADVNSAAAIALSKLAPGSSGVLKSNGTTITAGNTISAADLDPTVAVKKIAEVVGTGSSPVLELASIPSTFRSLRPIGDGRSDAALVTVVIQVTFETSPTAGAYNRQTYVAAGASLTGAESLGVDSFINVGTAPGASSDANLYGSVDIVFPEYASTTKFKTLWANVCDFRSIAASGLVLRSTAGLWESTAAIDRIRLTLASGNWTSLSRLTLYGYPG